MKNSKRIGIGVMLAFMLICVLVPMNVAATSGTLEVEADYYDEVSIGKLSPGDTITYSWNTADEADSITFLIGIKETEDTPDEKIYHVKEDLNSASGTLIVDTEGTYVLVFNNDNIMDTAHINYEYTTITKASNVKKDSDDSPAFELFGVAFAIALCIAVIGRKRRKKM